MFLVLSLSMNLGLLAYFKYANFFIENLNASLSNLGFNQIGWTEIFLPIGISFYTFQTLTYSIDVYRGVHVPLKKLTDYLLYIMSFPQMIAGPIVRFNLIADQITDREDRLDDRLFGFIRFSIGLAKKVFIANVMGEFADGVIGSDIAGLGSAEAWIGIIAYSFQIYFDFAGYSDMAIGLGRMMGFRFPENFDNPYISGSISEFWGRWHMTLGQWMKDYLYIPLGGNRVGSKGRLFFNLWFVFLVSGLWHGASWNFVFWGAFHGLFLILDRLFLLKVLKKTGRIFPVIFTYLIVLIGWVFFRIEDFGQAFLFVERMFAFENGITEIEINTKVISFLIIAIFFSFVRMSKVGEIMENFVFYKENAGKRWIIGMTAIALILFVFSTSSITTQGFNPFIYFRF